MAFENDPTAGAPVDSDQIFKEAAARELNTLHALGEYQQAHEGIYYDEHKRFIHLLRAIGAGNDAVERAQRDDNAPTAADE